MVRHYKRKTTTTYDLETLKNAVAEVRTGKINAYQAARKYNIPRTTICDRVNKRRGVVKETRGPPTVIDTENELRLANGLRALEKYGFGLTSKETRDLVNVYVSQNNYSTPFKNNRPGYDWFAGFKKRHNLSLKKPQAVEMSRKVACDPFIVNEYFDTLEEVLDELDLKGRPEKVWNLDESGFGNDPDRTKVVGARGFASTRTIASSGKDNVTILFTVSAAGDKLPPLIINRGKNTWDQWLSELGYQNTSYAATANGWIDSKVFEKYMYKIVLPHLSKDPPALLIFDGHSTHMQLKIWEEAQKRGVTIMKLPSHASHLLQPLDLSVFKSMKNTWDEKLVQWQRLNVGKKLPKDEFSRIIGEVWRDLNPTIIRNGFKKGGIYPFNRAAVPEDKFDPVSLKRFKQYKNINPTLPRFTPPSLKELTLQKVLHKINSSSQVPKIHTQITLNENNIVNIKSNTASKPQLILSAASSKLPLQSQGMGFSNSNVTNTPTTPTTTKINITEDRILPASEKVSFETLLLQKINRCDPTVKLKKTKISKGCEVVTREEVLEKKRKEEEDKAKIIEMKKELKEQKKKEKENKDPHRSKKAKLSDKIEKAKRKSDVSLPKKKKTDKRSTKKVKKQKKRVDYDDESEVETDISYDESDKSCADFGKYLAGMEDFDNLSLYISNENEIVECFSKDDANIADEFEPVVSRSPEVHDWVSKEAKLSDESEIAKEKAHASLSKKKKTDTKSKKRVKKQKKCVDYDDESEVETDISYDESDKSCADFEKYLAEMEDFDNLSLYTGNETDDCFCKDDANIVDEFEPNVCRRNPEVNDWILVRFTTKKSVKHFVGNIISVNENNIPNVKFLRKIKNSRFMSFHYPDVEDISEIKHDDDIVMFLKKPDISRRGHVTFKENLKKYNIQ